nr:MAG TPA: hypothetical protein [Caudoviricetes sp.]
MCFSTSGLYIISSTAELASYRRFDASLSN